MSNLRLEPGEVDDSGRRCKEVAGELVLTKSAQVSSVAACTEPTCTLGEGGVPWKRSGANAMGTGARHAAAHGHRVLVHREMATEYDGATPRQWPEEPTRQPLAG